MTTYYAIARDFNARAAERIGHRCKAIVKGWRANNYKGDVPVQCSRLKHTGPDGEYCCQHARIVSRRGIA